MSHDTNTSTRKNKLVKDCSIKREYRRTYSWPKQHFLLCVYVYEFVWNTSTFLCDTYVKYSKVHNMEKGAGCIFAKQSHARRQNIQEDPVGYKAQPLPGANGRSLVHSQVPRLHLIPLLSFPL